jgi:hypothetical protein
VKGIEVKLINDARHSDDSRLNVAKTAIIESRRIQEVFICKEEANGLKSEMKKLILFLRKVD